MKKLTAAQRRQTVQNFIQTHGQAAFRTLIEGFEDRRSLQALGKELNLSRERIRQLQAAFGRKETTYWPYPETTGALRLAAKEDKGDTKE